MEVEVRRHPDQVYRPLDEPDDVSDTGGWPTRPIPGGSEGLGLQICPPVGPTPGPKYCTVAVALR